MINCIVYSVVAALFVQKGWKKQNGKRHKVGRPEISAKAKELFEDQACKIRVNQSRAKAELERIKSNRKITRKGKKNRAALLKECKTPSVASLVAYMEKEKSKLRKLKRRFWSRKKNEDARRMNREFQLDPGRVYTSFKETIESQGDCERPSYEHVQQDKEITQRLFTDVNEASSFWKALWE